MSNFDCEFEKFGNFFSKRLKPKCRLSNNYTQNSIQFVIETDLLGLIQVQEATDVTYLGKTVLAGDILYDHDCDGIIEAEGEDQLLLSALIGDSHATENCTINRAIISPAIYPYTQERCL